MTGEGNETCAKIFSAQRLQSIHPQKKSHKKIIKVPHRKSKFDIHGVKRYLESSENGILALRART